MRDLIYLKQWRMALRSASGIVETHYVLGHMLDVKSPLRRSSEGSFHGNGFGQGNGNGNGNGEVARWREYVDGDGENGGDIWGMGGGDLHGNGHGSGHL
jgi:hypothetical protein